MASYREQEALAPLTFSSRQVLEPFYVWAKQGRERFHIDFDFEAQNFQSGRLVQSTYNSFEVGQILNDQKQALLLAAVREEECIALASGEVMKELLLELDRNQIQSHVATMSLLGNRAISAVEASEQKILKSQRSLAPITALDRGDETARQLVQVHEEKRKLQEKLRLVTDQLTSVMREKSQFNDQVAQLSDREGVLQQQLSMTAQMSHEQLQHVLQERDRTIAGLQQQVAGLTREMSEKLSQSSQFINLKNMLAERNAQVQHLRLHLRRYDPAAAGADDDIEATDDD